MPKPQQKGAETTVNTIEYWRSFVCFVSIEARTSARGAALLTEERELLAARMSILPAVRSAHLTPFKHLSSHLA